MEIANMSVAPGHGRPFLDMKRYSKGSELDNWSMGDFLTVDDLLDFSNEDIAGPIGEVFHPNEASVTIAEKQSCNSSAERRNSGEANVLGEGPAELYVPCDDLAELEWLSNFVEESFSSGHSSTHIFGTDVNDSHHGEQKDFQTGKQEFHSASPISVLESGSSSAKIGNFIPDMTVPGRARSKRPRCGASFWSTRILSADPLASILDSSSTSTVTATTPLSPDSDAFFSDQGGADSLSAKKLYKNKSKNAQDNVQTRRCLHCATQRTPQWRTGPMGPKTLCNACGVRFKSGRLLPEYRPAQSPTFVEAIHSNSHRKVLEMRRQKEQQDHIQEGQKLFESEYEDDVCVVNRRD